MEQYFDLLVIGGGPGGYPAALKAAKLGKRVALAERRELGGTCLNRGCIPTKTLLHSTETFREIGRAQELGIHCQTAEFEPASFWQYKDKVVGTLRDGIGQMLKKQKVTVFSGSAKIVDAAVPGAAPASGNTDDMGDGGLASAAVNGTAGIGGDEVYRAGSIITAEVTAADGTVTTVKASHVLIAAGSRPAVLPIPGIDSEGVMNSDTVLDENRLGVDSASRYDTMIIIGGGVIGMEMATAYSNLGTRVTVIEAMDRILPGMDKEISQNLKMILKKRGVEIVTSAMVKEIVREDGKFICRYAVKNKKGIEEPGEAKASGLLVSTGRRPETVGLFAESLPSEGLFTGRGYLSVDENYRTTLPGVYGVGDVIGGIQLAHMATAEGYRAVEHMFGLPFSQNLAVIPSCVYTDPEIACVGLTADEAKAKGLESVTGKYIMSVNGKSVLTLQERGFIKLVAEKETGRLLGAQLMCTRATDIIGELGLAIVKGLTVKDLASQVMAHPTFAEGICEAAEAMLEE